MAGPYAGIANIGENFVRAYMGQSALTQRAAEIAAEIEYRNRMAKMAEQRQAYEQMAGDRAYDTSLALNPDPMAYSLMKQRGQQNPIPRPSAPTQPSPDVPRIDVAGITQGVNKALGNSAGSDIEDSIPTPRYNTEATPSISPTPASTPKPTMPEAGFKDFMQNAGLSQPSPTPAATVAQAQPSFSQQGQRQKGAAVPGALERGLEVVDAIKAKYGIGERPAIPQMSGDPLTDKKSLVDYQLANADYNARLAEGMKNEGMAVSVINHMLQADATKSAAWARGGAQPIYKTVTEPPKDTSVLRQEMKNIDDNLLKANNALTDANSAMMMSLTPGLKEEIAQRISDLEDAKVQKQAQIDEAENFNRRILYFNQSDPSKRGELTVEGATPPPSQATSGGSIYNMPLPPPKPKAVK